jgi:hypothetical protein
MVGVAVRSALRRIYWFARSRLPARLRVKRRVCGGYEIFSEPHYIAGYGWSRCDHCWPVSWSESRDAALIKDALSSPIFVAIPGAWSVAGERKALDMARAALAVRD